MTTTKKIYNAIEVILNFNPCGFSTEVAKREFMNSQNRELKLEWALRLLEDIRGCVAGDSLAAKICSQAIDNGKYFFGLTPKQIWVLAFELEKSELNEGVNKCIAEYEAVNAKASAKSDAASAKIAENKEASAGVLERVKDAGKLLKDYYNFVKSSREFKREYFSKKFTNASVDAFLAL